MHDSLLQLPNGWTSIAAIGEQMPDLPMPLR